MPAIHRNESALNECEKGEGIQKTRKFFRVFEWIEL